MVLVVGYTNKVLVVEQRRPEHLVEIGCHNNHKLVEPWQQVGYTKLVALLARNIETVVREQSLG